MTRYAKRMIWSTILFWSHLLRKGAYMQKSNALKKLCLTHFFKKYLNKMQFNFFKQKHHIERIKKNAQHDVFGFLIPYKVLPTIVSTLHSYYGHCDL